MEADVNTCDHSRPLESSKEQIVSLVVGRNLELLEVIIIANAVHCNPFVRMGLMKF